MEKEACVLQKNMKAWVMRRNYQSMRDSVRKLQLIWREKKNAVEEEEEEELEDSDDAASAQGMRSSGGVLSRTASVDVGALGDDDPRAGLVGGGSGTVVEEGEARQP